MQILKAIIIISLIIITAYNAFSRPALHKQIVIAPENFKIASVNKKPNETYNTILFKISDSIPETETTSTETKTEETAIIQSTEEVKIIPSVYANRNNQSQKTVSSYDYYLAKEQEKLELSNKINSQTMKNAASRRENEALEYEKQRKSQQDSLNTIRKNNSRKSDDSIENLANDLIKGSSCPICDTIKNGGTKQSKEVIAWNIWRSNIQNRIMDTSAIESDIGVLFTFRFYVDEYGNITNIEVRSTDRNEKSKNAVKQAILRLDKKLLKFPLNTKRKKVLFTGGFITSIYSEYSSPSDYSDFEQIIRTTRY